MIWVVFQCFRSFQVKTKPIFDNFPPFPIHFHKTPVQRITKSKYMNASDLLVELNSIAGPKDDKDKIFNTIKAIKLCIMERSIFTTDVIAQTIQKLTQVFEDPASLGNLGRRSRKSGSPPAFTMRTT